MGEAGSKTKTHTPTRRVVVPIRRPQAALPTLRLVQPALKVGAVNDPAEREAETMAARVVASSAPMHSVAATAAGGNGTGDTSAQPLRRAEDDQPTTDDLKPEPVSADQAEFELPKTQDVDAGGLDKGETDEIDSGKPVDTGGEEPAPESPPIEDAPPPLAAMRRSGEDAVTVGRMGGDAPQDVSQLVANPGPGRRLPSGLRQRVEPHFGTTFENVRLHTTPSDQKAAARIGARAFTHRNHIWLAEGETETNTRLMAHELTHVVQQTKGAKSLPMNRAAAIPDQAQREPTIRRGYFANKAESVARHVPGYTLITVLLGKTLISRKKVPMNAENLMGGLMGLVPGGTLIFDRLNEARVIQEAFDWVKNKLHELNLTWSRIKSDLSDALDTYNPFKAARNVKNMIVRLVKDIVRFVKAITLKVLEFIIRGALKIAGSYGEKIWGILKTAGDTIKLILENPLEFGINLLKSVVGGFVKFGKNILTHLKNGLLGWLFGALAGAGIEMPAKLDFKGIMSLVMQVLGLTYENFRKQLVKKLGPSGEKKVAMIEKSIEIVKILIKEGFAGIWKKILEMVDNFKSTFVGEMMKMVTATIVRAGLGWLAGLSNPAGAIIKIILAIYDIIKTFLERLDQIIDVAQSIFSSIGAIAKGQIGKAIDFVEATIGKTVPVVISFLAALLGLGGIASKIKGVIMKLQAPVKKAMGKLIGFVIKKGKKLFSKVLGKINKGRKLPSRNFKVGKKQHRIFAEKKGKKVVMKIASNNPATLSATEKATLAQLQKVEDAKAKKIGRALAELVGMADDKTLKLANKTNPDNERASNKKALEDLDKRAKDYADRFQKAATEADANPNLSSQDIGDELVRAAVPRSFAFEGKVASYNDLQAEAKKPFNSTVSTPLSKFYDLDHTIEKRFPKKIVRHLADLEKGTKDGPSTKSVDNLIRQGKAPKPDPNAESTGAVKVGELGRKYKKIDETAGDFPAIATYQGNHVANKGKGLPDQSQIIDLARKEKLEKRSNKVKQLLKGQFEAEKADINQALDKDPLATSEPAVGKLTKIGLKKIEAKNQEIYKWGNMKGEIDPARKANSDSASGGSSFTFGQKFDGTKLKDIEGIGVLYGQRKKGLGNIFEYDHVLDQAFVRDAKTLPILSEEQANAVLQSANRKRKKIKTKQPPLADLNNRRKILRESGLLFKANSYVQNFGSKGNPGYSIPINRSVAKAVSSAMSSSGFKTVTKQPLNFPDSRKLKFADYLLTDDAGILEKGRRLVELDARKRYVDRTNAHAAAIAKGYMTQVRYVSEANKKDDQKTAATAMAKIVTQVNTSLGTSEQKTKSAFP